MPRAIKKWEWESFIFSDGRILKRYRRNLLCGDFLSMIEEYYNKNANKPFIINSVFKKKDGELISKKFKNLSDAVVWCDFMAIKDKWFLAGAFKVYKGDL